MSAGAFPVSEPAMRLVPAPANALKPLAERIEVGIRERTERRVEDALAQARDVAFRAYSMALRATCGIPFDVVIADVMSEAEKSLRAQAIAHGTRAETESFLRRLEAAQPGEPACNT